MLRGKRGAEGRCTAFRVIGGGDWGIVAALAVASAVMVLSGCAGLNNNPNGLTPEAVQISPASINFPNLAIGQKATQIATLTNTGSEAVTISRVELSSTQFEAAGIRTPLSIGPGQSTRFQVVYTAASSGPTTGMLTAMTAHGGSSSKTRLRGAGATSTTQLALSTTAVNFGKVMVNGSSTQAVALKNNGSTDIHVSQIALSGGAFSISGAAVPLTISAGQSVAVQANFAPTAAGSVTGAIDITSDAQNSLAAVSLSGTGVAASYTMSLLPGSINFGNIAVGSSATQNVQLSNTGNSTVTVMQIAASGSGISVNGISMPLSLAPSQSVALAVRFAPTAAGAVSGGISVVSSDGTNVATSVTGTGTQPALSVTPGSVAFPSVVVGNTNSQTLQLKNIGNADLVISQATVTGAGFSLSGLAAPLTLSAGQSTGFNIQCAPQSAGAVTGTLTIVSNAPNSPATVGLTGTGLAASYALSVNPGSLSFGTVTDGSTASQGFTITNTGNSNVAISGVTASGTGFSIASGAGAVTLSPNQSTTVTVQFAPSATGSATGTATILSNATNSASPVSLNGVGAAPVTHSVALNWQASTSTVTGYNVYRSSVSGSAYAKVNGSLVSGVTYADSGVQSGQTYYYVATSVDSNGNESSFSNEVSAVVP